MDNIITFENIHSYAYLNDSLVKGKPKALVIRFFGLNVIKMFEKDEHGEEGIFYGEHDVLFLIPYLDPWSWACRKSINTVDTMIDVIFKHYNLSDDFPIISTGGSMGGQGAIVYSYYAKRTPVCCLANCPVCDLIYHYTERPDTARTIYCAFADEPGDLEQVLKKYSPIHLADRLPDIPYYIFASGADSCVSKEAHSDRFVSVISKNRKVELTVSPEKDHGEMTTEARKTYLSIPLKYTL